MVSMEPLLKGGCIFIPDKQIDYLLLIGKYLIGVK
jgi:hypothetical protein